MSKEECRRKNVELRISKEECRRKNVEGMNVEGMWCNGRNVKCRRNRGSNVEGMNVEGMLKFTNHRMPSKAVIVS